MYRNAVFLAFANFVNALLWIIFVNMCNGNSCESVFYVFPSHSGIDWTLFMTANLPDEPDKVNGRYCNSCFVKQSICHILHKYVILHRDQRFTQEEAAYSRNRQITNGRYYKIVISPVKITAIRIIWTSSKLHEMSQVRVNIWK